MRNKILLALQNDDDDDDDDFNTAFMGFPNPTGHGTDFPFYFDVDNDMLKKELEEDDWVRLAEYVVYYNDSGVAKLIKGMKYTLDMQGYGYTDVGSKHKVYQFQALGYIQLQSYRWERIAPEPGEDPIPTRVDFRAFQEGFPRFFSKGHNSCSIGDLVLQPNTALVIRVIFYDLVSEVRVTDTTTYSVQPYLQSWDPKAENFDCVGYLTGVCTVSNYVDPQGNGQIGR